MNGDFQTATTELNMEGFKVVRSDMFCKGPRMLEPVCTIWPTKIGFNKSCIKALNYCEFVRFEVNPVTKGLVVVPCTSKDDDSIRWIKGEKDPVVRNLQSTEFGDQLYRSWKLDEAFNYRAYGRLALANQKVMLFFDFSRAEQWTGKRDNS
ncbi:MAG: hypothetical protein E7298_14340 [Lachnospiraceae bacterium]|nr:hypothetical protein [Lachnospiraceae bacterium]